MNTPSSHYLALIVALFALALPVHAALYEFSIAEAPSYTPVVGTGDAARSQALRFANGAIVVSIPLDTLRVSWLPNLTYPGWLDVYAPPPGVIIANAVPQYYAELGGSPPSPSCNGTGPGCVVPLGYAYVNWVSLPVDIWGHFEGDTWVPNPDPGTHSFVTLPPPGSVPLVAHSFSMRPVIPEPPIVALLALGFAAVGVRAARSKERRA